MIDPITRYSRARTEASVRLTLLRWYFAGLIAGISTKRAAFLADIFYKPHERRACKEAEAENEKYRAEILDELALHRSAA